MNIEDKWTLAFTAAFRLAQSVECTTLNLRIKCSRPTGSRKHSLHSLLLDIEHKLVLSCHWHPNNRRQPVTRQPCTASWLEWSPTHDFVVTSANIHTHILTISVMSVLAFGLMYLTRWICKLTVI